jgi:hypothetical protein
MVMKVALPVILGPNDNITLVSNTKRHGTWRGWRYIGIHLERATNTYKTH